MATAKRLAAKDEETGGLTFQIDSPVNVAQLDAEIVEAMNWRVPAGLIVDVGRFDEGTTIFRPINEDDEVGEDADDAVTTLTVTHRDPDPRVIAEVIKAHEPDPHWQEAPAAEEGPSLAALAKKAQVEPLTLDDMQRAIILLLAPHAEG